MQLLKNNCAMQLLKKTMLRSEKDCVMQLLTSPDSPKEDHGMGMGVLLKHRPKYKYIKYRNFFSRVECGHFFDQTEQVN